MYTFELLYVDLTTEKEKTITIQIDSTPIECKEVEIYLSAMAKAYHFCNDLNNNAMFLSLSLISC